MITSIIASFHNCPSTSLFTSFVLSVELSWPRRCSPPLAPQPDTPSQGLGSSRPFSIPLPPSDLFVSLANEICFQLPLILESGILRLLLVHCYPGCLVSLDPRITSIVLVLQTLTNMKDEGKLHQPLIPSYKTAWSSSDKGIASLPVATNDFRRGHQLREQRIRSRKSVPCSQLFAKSRASRTPSSTTTPQPPLFVKHQSIEKDFDHWKILSCFFAIERNSNYVVAPILPSPPVGTLPTSTRSRLNTRTPEPLARLLSISSSSTTTTSCFPFSLLISMLLMSMTLANGVFGYNTKEHIDEHMALRLDLANTTPVLFS